MSNHPIDPASRSVVIVENARVPAYPKEGVATVATLGDALVSIYPCDAHFSPYTPSVPRRLKGESLRLGQTAEMTAMVFDLDDVESKKRGQPASEAWRQDVCERVGKLNELMPGLYFYWTRGGARLVYGIEEAALIVDDATAGDWQLTMLSAMFWLKQEVGLDADLACKDWTRLFRLPHATRTPGTAPEDWGDFGDLNRLGTWRVSHYDAAIRKDAEANVSKKYRKRSVNGGRPMRHRRGAVGSAGRSLLFHAFQAKGWLGAQVEPGKFDVICPFSGGHSTGHDLDNSTVLFDEPGLGHVHCSHASCESRSQEDFIEAFSAREMDDARRLLAKTAGRVPVRVGPDEHRVIQDTITVLRDDEHLLVRGTELVHLVGVGAGANQRPHARPMPEPVLRTELSRRIFFFSLKEGRTVEHPPPRTLVKAVHSLGDWPGLRRLEGFTRLPVIRPDGSLLFKAGHDPATGIFHAPLVDIHDDIERVETADLQQAVRMLLSLVRDFPFVDATSRSAFLAHVLTHYVQFAVVGPIPIIFYDANSPGSGKTLLARVASTLGTGVTVAPLNLPARSEEQRKVITTLAREATRVAFFDNLVGDFGSGPLEILGTTRVWKDRLLGGNQTFEGPLDLVTVVTANNVTFRARDTARRVLPIRLETNLERPEERTDIRDPQLMRTIGDNLDAFVWAALTILRGWVLAGKPTTRLRPWGSYEDWSFWVRNPIVWLGLPDPYEPERVGVDMADSESLQLAALLDGLAMMLAASGRSRLTAREILSALERDRVQQFPGSRRHAAMEDAILALRGQSALNNSHTFGHLLKKFRGKIIGGRKIEKAGLLTGDNTWTVVCLAGGNGGLGGTPGG